VIAHVPSTTGRLAAFARRELGADTGRLRAFGRTLVGVLLATATVLIFKPTNGYWTVSFALLVSSPAVGKSELDALRRVLAALIGGAAATAVVIAAYDLPWLYVLLQSAGVGLALFLFGGTSLGPAVLTGGTTFLVITGGNRELGASGFVDLAWDRLLQAAVGSTLGAFAQLTFWRTDPLVELRRSLLAELGKVEAVLRGRPASLDFTRVSRHFELLGHVELRHPAFRQQEAALSLLILDVGRLVDQALVRETVPDGPQAISDALLREMRALLRRCDESASGPFGRPPPPPPAPARTLAWPGFLSPSHRLIRRAAMKAAIAALVTLVVLDAMQFPAAGGLLACLVLNLMMATGTDFSKALTMLGALVIAMGITLITSLLAAPNVDDFGSYLLVAAAAFAPMTWAAIAGPRVRFPGLNGAILVAIGVFGPYYPTSDLTPSSNFFVALAIGVLVVTAVDRAVWPVHREGVRAGRLVLLMHHAANLMGDVDPRAVLRPSCEPRVSANRALRGVIEIHGETTPTPGTPAFARSEETIRLATETQRKILDRVEMAQRELDGAETLADTAAQRRAWAADLRAQADRIERLRSP
jgi:uncharacterized membrane protein YccC